MRKYIETGAFFGLATLLVVLIIFLISTCTVKINNRVTIKSLPCENLSCAGKGDLVRHKLTGDTLMYLRHNALDGYLILRTPRLGIEKFHIKEIEYIVEDQNDKRR